MRLFRSFQFHSGVGVSLDIENRPADIVSLSNTVSSRPSFRVQYSTRTGKMQETRRKSRKNGRFPKSRFMPNLPFPSENKAKKIGAGSRIRTEDRRWCQNNGYNSPVCSARFKNALQRMFPGVNYTRKNKSQERVTVIEGISLQDGVLLFDRISYSSRITSI